MEEEEGGATFGAFVAFPAPFVSFVVPYLALRTASGGTRLRHLEADAQDTGLWAVGRCSLSFSLEANAPVHLVPKSNTGKRLRTYRPCISMTLQTRRMPAGVSCMSASHVFSHLQTVA